VCVFCLFSFGGEVCLLAHQWRSWSNWQVNRQRNYYFFILGMGQGT
jgi:hypothetical protein